MSLFYFFFYARGEFGSILRGGLLVFFALFLGLGSKRKPLQDITKALRRLFVLNIYFESNMTDEKISAAEGNNEHSGGKGGGLVVLPRDWRGLEVLTHYLRVPKTMIKIRKGNVLFL